MPFFIVEIEEVNHITSENSVNQISKSSGQDQGKRDFHPLLSGRCLEKIIDNKAQGDKRGQGEAKKDKKVFSPREKAKNRSLVVDVSQIKKAGNNIYAAINSYAPADNSFCQLISRDPKENEEKVKYPPLHYLISRTTPSQRLQK